jgi:hypothetical protein
MGWLTALVADRHDAAMVGEATAAAGLIFLHGERDHALGAALVHRRSLCVVRTIAARFLFQPIFYPQARHLLKVSQVAGDQSRVLRPSDTCNKQVRPTDFAKFPVLSQGIELGTGRRTERDYAYFGEVAFGLL